MDFEKFINEIKLKIKLKTTLDINDVIIIIAPDVLLFGIVTKIERDMSKKIDWWHVTFTTLSIPLQQMTIIMRTEQMTGQETFTMDGQYRFFSAIDINIEEEKPVKEVKKKPTLTLLKKEKQ